ncbi:MAG: tetraacyldisaccharide 4'-kinase [Phycisphaerales bacterium]|nr:tetraacyldisaccharide 4'-kinase [Phycisphaerales bacterium]
MKSPLPSWLDVLTIPLSWMYGAIVRVRNAHYDKQQNVNRVSLPVIAVGNVTVGGTGKSPLVRWIVRRLRANGYNPAIVMRGYKAVTPELADEAVEYKEKFGEIDVIVGGNRYEHILAYIESGGSADCLVMDDGFQHRKLHRDLDIVVLDFLRDTFSQRMLPAGWLREPICGLQRADAIVVSHVQSADPDYAEEVKECSGSEPIAWAEHHWTRLQVHDATGSSEEALDWLAGKSVAIRLGIGYPGPVIEALVRLGAKIAKQLPASDHQPFSKTEIATLVATSQNVDAIVMTLKDWVKARDVMDVATLQCPIVVPDLVLDIVEGADALEAQLLSVFNIR